MKPVYLLVALLLTNFLQPASAQPPWDWAERLQGTGSAFPQSMAIDNAGTIYIAGWFDGTVDFDPGSAQFILSSQAEDGFLLRLRADGTFDWAVSIGGNGYDGIMGADVDANGNVFCTGYFYDTIRYSTALGTDSLFSAGNADAFIAALDSDGVFLWAGSIGGASGDYGLAIAASLSATAGVEALGSFSGTADLDPGNGVFNANASGQDLFITKTDFSGNFAWADIVGGTGSSVNGTDLEMDSSGAVYFTGYFDGAADFDPSAGSYLLTSVGSSPGGEDAFVCKLNSNGSMQWAKQISGSDYAYSHSLSVDPVSGDVYYAGRFYGNTDFDPGPGTFNVTPAGDAAFLSRMDSAGNFIWARSIDVSPGSFDARYTVVYSPFYRACHLSGVFQGGVDMDPDPGSIYYAGSMGLDDIFYSYFDTAGTFRWVKQLGNVQTESGVVMDLPPTGVDAPVFAGWFNSPSLNFGVTQLANPASTPAMFIAKPDYQVLGRDEPVRKSALRVFPVPAQDMIAIEGFDRITSPECTLSVFDSKGQVICVSRVQVMIGKALKINVSSFTPGIYLLKLDGNEHFTSRFIVLR